MDYKPPYIVTDTMLTLVGNIMENLGSLQPVNSLEKIPRLRKVSRIKSIHSSLAIEHNSLTVDQVTSIINGKRVLGPQDDIIAVKNAIETYKNISSYNPYSVNDLLDAHKTMMSNLLTDAGSFRNGNVGVVDEKGHIIHMAPPSGVVIDNIKNLFDYLENSQANILIKSCVFHYEFEFIHPFSDGNGRMGRLWQTVILAKWKPIFEWIPIESIIKDRQIEYYQSIEESTSKVLLNPFIEFMLKCINDAIVDCINDTRNHYNHISKQVNALMDVLESYPMSASELMKKLNLKSKESFRSNYLKPAIEDGLILMTVPDKPTSKNQRYYKNINI